MDFPGLRSSLRTVQDRIRHHQGIGGWTHPVRIVAVTKTHGPEAVRAAAAAGLLDIGENRVQEALAKQDQLTDLAVRWHLIGTLQRNKARHAVGRFALIHSVDRAELADELARRAAPGSRQPILVEVNCSGESQKGGVEPAGLPALLDRIRGLPSLELSGLMTMAALTADIGQQRTAFGRLRAERDRMTAAGYPLPELSMGMSGDYPIAVEEGATMVRLGTLLFGERTP
jgi:pyridoxal phosphate enzyme (YggS family)